MRRLSTAKTLSGNVWFKEMRIKSVPQIVFLKDDSMEYSQKIEKMLSSLEGGKNEKE